MNSEELLNAYVRDLESAAYAIAPGRRRELIEEVREHIEAGLEAAGSRDEVAMRNVLERVGSPEDIVAAEGAEDRAGSPPSATHLVTAALRDHATATPPPRRSGRVVVLLAAAAIATLLVLTLLPDSRTAVVSVAFLLAIVATLITVVLALTRGLRQ